MRPDPVMPEFGGRGQIMTARNDGSEAKVIAHGSHPVVAPDGRRVAYFTFKTNQPAQVRIVSIKGGRSS